MTKQNSYKNGKGKSKGANNSQSRGHEGQRSYDANAKTYQKRPNMANKKERWDAAEKSVPVPYNDKTWYSKYGDLKVNFANFNFRLPVGSQNYFNNPVYSDMDADRFAGVMSIFFSPAFGDNVDGEMSPLNLAATRLYQFTRFENNGSSMYDRGDLMLYYLAMDSAYMCHAWMRRIYGCLNAYSNMNRYVPNALVKANRVDFEDLRKHIADFRGFINEYAHKLSVLPVPNSIAYINRHVWMADNIFVDQDSVKCQMYQFVPFYFSKFGIETEGEHVGEPYLDLIRPTYNRLLTFADLRELADSLIEPLIANEDFNLIGSDVIKAFGTNGLYRVESMPDDYRIVPVFSEEVLDQIQNACAMGNPGCVPLGDGTVVNRGHAIYWDSDTNTLVPYTSTWVPYDATQTLQFSANPFMGNRLVNFRRNEITHDDIMVATRLTVGRGVASAVSGHVAMRLCGIGSEIVNSLVVYFYTTADTGEWRLGQTQPIYYALPQVVPEGRARGGADAEELANNIVAAYTYGAKAARETARQLSQLEMFDRHPSVITYWMYAVIQSRDGVAELVDFNTTLNDITSKSIRRFGDVDNYAFFTNEDLHNLSEVALLSEFYVPLTASGALAMSTT